MEVILLDSVYKLGDRGQVVKVKPGYARNYLFPRRLALPATEGNRRVFQENERHLIKRDIEAAQGARERAAKLGDLSVSITVQVGDEDKLYGSVTSLDIVRKLGEQGHEIDRREVMLDEPIKALGEYTVDVRLHRDVTVPVKVQVVKE
ncbi:MAG TPA: 50S ribosomal protein L9 [Candidatus Krumholzibacteria bacterium]|nr:50S ribosomal protein L9 [Candidatus Krumholzibacteria bacterium]